MAEDGADNFANKRVKDEAKPEAKPEVINITIKSSDGEVAFKIKKSTKMSKVFAAYAQKKGVADTHFRFVFEGVRIHGNVTAEEADLEDGDVIDAFVEQQGGAH